MQQPHIYAACPFVVAAEAVCLKNFLEIFSVLRSVPLYEYGGWIESFRYARQDSQVKVWVL